MKKERAEALRRYLRQRNLLNLDYKIFSKGNFIYVPITGVDNAAAKALKTFGASSTYQRFEPQKRREGKKIRAVFDAARYGALAYDVLGNIAIINESKHARALAKAIIESNPRISTVLMKKGAVKGKYRKRRYAYVLGKKSYTACYRENGCVFSFDIRKAFFSPRLAYERKRITEQVKEGERVLVMFAGVGPFAIEIAKHKKAEVAAIELNAYAYKSMIKNAELNNVKIKAVCGDVRKEAKRFSGWADRIVMPLPKSSYDFLGQALEAAKRRCVVHYYAFGKGNSAYNYSKKRIASFLNAHGAKANFMFERAVRPYSPSEIEIVIDFEIEKKQARTAKNQHA
ncbi:MAG: class I SAM-dependent methyltransferase family protein [Candidatus Micrarchaeaceae archaeon]